MTATIKAAGARSWREVAYHRTIKGQSPLEHFQALEDLRQLRLPDEVVGRHAAEDEERRREKFEEEKRWR